jgi:Flp pilus assembly protein TadD
VILAVTDPATTWCEAAHLHFALADYESAGWAYGFAAAHRPDDAAIQIRLALTCHQLGDRASAQGYLDRALSLDPLNPQARKLLDELALEER